MDVKFWKEPKQDRQLWWEHLFTRNPFKILLNNTADLNYFKTVWEGLLPGIIYTLYICSPFWPWHCWVGSGGVKSKHFIIRNCLPEQLKEKQGPLHPLPPPKGHKNPAICVLPIYLCFSPDHHAPLTQNVAFVDMFYFAYQIFERLQ